jgi:hypothetical protein
MSSLWDHLKNDHPLQVAIGMGLFVIGVITVLTLREEGTILSPGWALLMLLHFLAISIAYLLLAWLQRRWGVRMSFRTTLRVFPFVWCVVTALLLGAGIALYRFAR